MTILVTSPALFDDGYDHISMQKARLFVERVMKQSDPVPRYQAGPADADDLSLAHSPRFVNDVLMLKQENGYGTKSEAVNRFALGAVGAMARAAEIAMNSKESVCAPVHGFHHAGYASSNGFCTFNGLIVALRRARMAMKDPDYPVMILDLDAHFGDGTAEIITVLKLGAAIRHITHRGSTLLGQRTVRACFDQLWRLESEVERVIENTGKRPLVLYQAGADAHIDDPYGCGYLTTDQLRERDKMVFGLVRRKQLPCVWNLAGGYSDMELVLDIHMNTWEASQ